MPPLAKSSRHPSRQQAQRQQKHRLLRLPPMFLLQQQWLQSRIRSLKIQCRVAVRMTPFLKTLFATLRAKHSGLHDESEVSGRQSRCFRTQHSSVRLITSFLAEAIGGGSAQISALFGDDAEPSSGPLRNRSNESQSAAPSMSAAQQPHKTATSAKNPSSVATPVFTPSVGVTDSEGKDFRPTRRVREPIGGGSAQIASLFGGDDSENDVPRRR